MKYWLLKSEPDCYSIDDFKRDKKTIWSGIRNYQARNFLKEMEVGDLAIFYHSSANPPAAAGIAKITKAILPDTTAFNKKDDHYDPRATKENPIWYAPEVSFVSKFKEPIPLGAIKNDRRLEGIEVAKQGSRLSVMPVSKEHFEIIRKIGNS